MEEQEIIQQFITIALPILKNEKFISQKGFIQHGKTTTYDHVLNVAYTAYKKALKKKNYHMQDLIYGCLLHDFYLYDWHVSRKIVIRKGLHGFNHPLVAMINAKKEFPYLNLRVLNMIRSHMWPLTFFHLPASKEAYLLLCTDKSVSYNESQHKNERVYNKILEDEIEKAVSLAK